MTEVDELRARVAQLEAHVAALSRFVGMDPSAVPFVPAPAPAPAPQQGPPPIPDRVRELAADRQIQAIKELRAAWGIGLADAKRVVDDIRAGRV